VQNQQRELGGVYSFQVFDALTFETPKNVKGYYLVGNSSSSWSSKKNGDIELQGMRVGTTNLQSRETRQYYSNYLEHVVVKKDLSYQRPLALV
jgi:hypothetical protein